MQILLLHKKQGFYRDMHPTYELFLAQMSQTGFWACTVVQSYNEEVQVYTYCKQVWDPA